nr:hypothetical protein [uncultured Mediterranean phage uvMED]BAR17131.1 hypothetical protein [uncultured Mediterranean phage uvMED]
MANHPKIERGIQMPDRGNFKHDWLDKMEIGDSFVTLSSKVAGIRTAASNRGMKLTARRTKSNEHRVWRIS